MGKHRHVYSKLWSHYGPYGRQDVHFHPCVSDDGECSHVIEGSGRQCMGIHKPDHQHVDLAERLAKRSADAQGKKP